MNGGAHDHIVLSDSAFHAAEGDPTNLKLCQRGEWQDRMLVETVLSMLTLVSHFKKAMPRVWAYFRARLAFAMAASAGGIEALWHIFGALPADLPAVIAVVQHRSPREGSLLATVLKQCSQIAVHDAVSEECLQPGRIALAPANHHLLVTPDGSFALFDTVAASMTSRWDANFVYSKTCGTAPFPLVVSDSPPPA